MLNAYPIDPGELAGWVGLGVAGNFAGHLEQAGEAGDFAGVTTATAEAPKGIFPFYLPGGDGFLSVFPLSTETIAMPPIASPRLQIEPEVGLACSLEYDGSGRVRRILPLAFGAFNDCSLRLPGAAKISEKKNWGAASKGVSPRFLALGPLPLEEATARFRIACYLKRGGELHEYGIDSPLLGYSYYGQRLLAWIVETLAAQTGSPDSPLEPVGRYLERAGCPSRALIGIGATRYSAYGERAFLEPGDESIVVVYDSADLDPGAIEAAIGGGALASAPRASALIQRVL